MAWQRFAWRREDERPYVSTPTEVGTGFRALLEGAMEKTADHSAVLLPPHFEAGDLGVLVETGENRTRHKPSLAVATSRKNG